MTKKVKELRGLIYGLYDTEAALARQLGWPRQRLNKITSGAREPNIEELDILSKALKKPLGEIARFFLPK